MIQNHWYVVGESEQIKSKPVGLLRFGEHLVLWRNADKKLVVMEDRCVHRRTQLSTGRIIDGELECGFHGFRYQSSGQCSLIPANGQAFKVPASVKVKTYEVKEAKGLIWVWFGDKPADQELPWFTEFDDSRAHFVDLAFKSNISFCRLMENNMDFSHFPFVHRNYFTAQPKITFASKFDVQVDGLRIDMQGEFASDPATDCGKKRPKAVPVSGSILFPHMAMYGAPLDREFSQSVIFLCPVDEHNTWLHVRMYVKPGPFLGIRKWIKKKILLKRIWMHWVYPQDLRMWTKQDPRDSGLGKDRLLSPSDAMIAQYLRMYGEALKLQNTSPSPKRQIEPDLYLN